MTTGPPATTTRFRFRGAEAYRLHAPGARTDDIGAARGGAAIDIDVFPKAVVRRLLGVPSTTTAHALIRTFGPRTGAEDQLQLLPPEDAALGGAPAGTTAFAYRSGTLENIQGTVMANHAGTVVILDVNAEPGRAVGAGAAIRLVRDRWRWRTAGGSRARTGPVAAGFVGTTAQGEAIALDAGADRSLRYAFRFRPACPVLAALPHQSDFDTTTIHTTRRFHDSFTDAFDPDGNPRPVVAGRPRRLLLTTAVTFDGRLVSRSLARGTLRERVAVMDRDAFPGGGVLDACDTGPLPWQVARLF